MSHYAVLVIGPDPERQLAPYHEYECTGIDDEYVIDVDITDKVLAMFNTDVAVVILADGSVKSRWDDCFYTGTPDDDLGRRLGSKEFVLPTGARTADIPADEARKHGQGYATVAECAEEAFNVKEIDGRFYRHTNPNARWDWYQVGGRWTGTLKLKPGARGIIGRPGLMTSNAPPGYADQALKGDVDWSQMRNDADVKARALWKLCRETTGGMAWESWDDTRIRYPNIEDARREYHAQPAIELLRASGKDAFKWEVDDDLALDEEAYIQRRRDQACSFFAFVRDGEWTERGKMGWFGTASDEISKPQWNSMFNAMLDALPDDMLVTLVDCHI